MRRSTVRVFAIVTLALLGAPVAMHVVMHDLQDHHAEHAATHVGASGHGDHEHPIVSSPVPHAPSLALAALPVIAAAAATSVVWSSTARMERNVMAHGALRSDEDVGLQPLLSTFLI